MAMEDELAWQQASAGPPRYTPYFCKMNSALLLLLSTVPVHSEAKRWPASLTRSLSSTDAPYPVYGRPEQFSGVGHPGAGMGFSSDWLLPPDSHGPAPGTLPTGGASEGGTSAPTQARAAASDDSSDEEPWDRPPSRAVLKAGAQPEAARMPAGPGGTSESDAEGRRDSSLSRGAEREAAEADAGASRPAPPLELSARGQQLASSLHRQRNKETKSGSSRARERGIASAS
eukprot:3886469-Rhodomonas_salina.1